MRLNWIKLLTSAVSTFLLIILPIILTKAGSILVMTIGWTETWPETENAAFHGVGPAFGATALLAASFITMSVTSIILIEGIWEYETSALKKIISPFYEKLPEPKAKIIPVQPDWR